MKWVWGGVIETGGRCDVALQVPLHTHSGICSQAHAVTLSPPSPLFPPQDFGELQVAVVSSCQEAGLQPVAAFVTKVIQLYETFNVRFGVMLVGPTGKGQGMHAGWPTQVNGAHASRW